jgi:hypothetical protein
MKSALAKIGIALVASAIVLGVTSGMTAASEPPSPGDENWSLADGATPENRDM